MPFLSGFGPYLFFRVVLIGQYGEMIIHARGTRLRASPRSGGAWTFFLTIFSLLIRCRGILRTAITLMRTARNSLRKQEEIT
jgi:hypothetical protein